MGFSDITNLHVAIRQRTGLVTFYGPGFTAQMTYYETPAGAKVRD